MLYLFEDCALDTDRRELRRGAAIVPLEPQVFDLLAFLVRNRDRVVTKDDLLASVWGGRIVSESTLGTRLNAARTAVADSGEAQRLIRTLPRKGFRFVGEVREETVLPSKVQPAEPAAEAGPATILAIPAHDRVAPSRRWISPATLIAAAGVAAAVILLGALELRPAGQPTARAGGQARFDPAMVPLVDANDRAALADYARQPDYKALAISAIGLGQAVAAPDIEAAKTEALERCRLRPQSVCTLYAVGMDVVWPSGIVPLPASGDQRTELLTDEFSPAGLLTINPNSQRLAEIYAGQGNHRALAMSQRMVHWMGQKASLGEAIRLATERCGYEGQLPCLLISADGFWTVELPTSRRPINIFLPGTEAQLPADDRKRIAAVYQGKPWRALAHGRNGTWHAVAGAASEAAAVEAALQACAKADSECRLFAIGNFRVAEDQ